HSYWVGGGLVGVAVASVLPAQIEGLEFALCALFLTLTLDACRSRRAVPSLVLAGLSFGLALVLVPDSALFAGMLGFVALLVIRCLLGRRRESAHACDRVPHRRHRDRLRDHLRAAGPALRDPAAAAGLPPGHRDGAVDASRDPGDPRRVHPALLHRRRPRPAAARRDRHRGDRRRPPAGRAPHPAQRGAGNRHLRGAGEPALTAPRPMPDPPPARRCPPPGGRRARPQTDPLRPASP